MIILCWGNPMKTVLLKACNGSWFRYVQGLEPWLVNRVLIRGDVQPSSVVMTGLPATEDTMFAPDLEAIRALPLSGSVELFIGVISSSNNYARRMAVRRTWLQYPSVRNRTVAVRFFVGLVSWEFYHLAELSSSSDMCWYCHCLPKDLLQHLLWISRRYSCLLVASWDGGAAAKQASEQGALEGSPHIRWHAASAICGLLWIDCVQNTCHLYVCSMWFSHLKFNPLFFLCLFQTLQTAFSLQL